MGAKVINGKEIAKGIREEIKKEVDALRPKKIVPGLAAVLVGDNPAAVVYVRNKRKACDEVGIYSEEHKLPANIAQADLLRLIDKLNKDKKIHGILVQLPLPEGIIDQKVILESISCDKDVDCFHPYNVGKLTIGEPFFQPCTPYGIIKLLENSGVDIGGKEAVVIGRSNIVGKPVSLMLLHRNATITICHSKTKNLYAVCRRADILVASIGKARMITADMVKEGAAVIDVGINRMDDGSIVGDVDYEEVAKKVGWITPVPGGVGPMTIAMLLLNTLNSAKREAGLI